MSVGAVADVASGVSIVRDAGRSAGAERLTKLVPAEVPRGLPHGDRHHPVHSDLEGRGEELHLFALVIAHGPHVGLRQDLVLARLVHAELRGEAFAPRGLLRVAFDRPEDLAGVRVHVVDAPDPGPLADFLVPLVLLTGSVTPRGDPRGQRGVAGDPHGQGRLRVIVPVALRSPRLEARGWRGGALQDQHAEAGSRMGLVVIAVPCSPPARGVLPPDQVVRSIPVPVVGAEVLPPGQSAHALEPVEVVEVPAGGCGGLDADVVT